jgi:putative heme-binding domain-containing protein
MKCHAIAGSGGQVGPGLESLGASAPVDYIIESILVPNKAVKEGFHAVAVTTTEGKLFTGIKVRETRTELVLRTAEDKELTIRAETIDETKPAPSLMPEGLTDTLTRQELLDLVRFLSELGKVGPYAVSKGQVVRTWMVLEPTPEAKSLWQRTGGAALASNDAAVTWASAYSTVNGVLPLEGLPTVGTDSQPLAVLRCRIELTTAGKVKLKMNAGARLNLWVDGSPNEFKDETILDLPAGLHVLTVAVNGKPQHDGVRCELEEVPGSTARARVVGGK